jgi:YfiH family protein
MSQQNGNDSDGFDLRTADGIRYLACVPLEAEGFVAAFSTRDGAGAGEPVTKTAARLAGAIGRGGATVVTCRQVHGKDVRVVTTRADATAPESACDALTALAPGILLGVKTADCVPILIADTKTRAVAAIHAGWRGTVERITERAFATMVSTWESRRGDCIAAIGPSVCGECYEVGAEVLGRLRAEFPYADRFVRDGEASKGFVDLKEANAIQLEMCGLKPDQIVVTDRCTICENDLFFSYRSEGEKAGRILSLVGDAR